jgi:glycosyltransferase involved in cell wall biosynthesis
MLNRSCPLVSVILPAYNAAVWLPRTLQSVLGQTYGHFEVIVIDDGSQDGTSQIVQTWSQQDQRIRLIQQQNAGVAAARNAGIAVAQGALIAPIDADDIWYPRYLEKLVACLVNAPAQVGVAYAWSRDIDADDRLTGGLHVATVTGNLYRTLLCHNFLGNASATVMRRDCLVQVGGYDSGMRSQQAQGCEDWDMYLRLAADYEFAVVPEFLVGYRKLGESMSGDGQAMARSHALMLAWAKRRFPAIPSWYYGLSRSSFCLYLAHQAYQSGQPQATAVWLQAARQAHPWGTRCRPDWHLLNYWQRRDRPALRTTPSIYRPPSQLAMRAKTWLKIWVTLGLHWLLSIGQPRISHLAAKPNSP